MNHIQGLISRVILYISISVLFHTYSISQEVYGIEYTPVGYNQEWTIYADTIIDDGFIRDLPNLNSTTRIWKWEFGDEFGEIRLGNNLSISEWTVQGGNPLVSIRSRFPRDFSSFRITDNEDVIILKRKFPQDPCTWIAEYKGETIMELQCAFAGDIREIEVFDYFSEGWNVQFKIACLFAVINSFQR